MRSVLSRLRRWLGDICPFRLRMPEFMLDLGARAGDLSSYLGWSPPMRTTAIAELRRGVDGDPQGWLDATGITPRSLDAVARATGDDRESLVRAALSSESADHRNAGRFLVHFRADRHHRRLSRSARHDDALRLSRLAVACFHHRQQPHRHRGRPLNCRPARRTSSVCSQALLWRVAICSAAPC